MVEIDADYGSLLVLRARNRTAARIALVNCLAGEREYKEEQRNDGEKEHEPNQDNHGPPPFCPESALVIEARSVIPVTMTLKKAWIFRNSRSQERVMSFRRER
jgi:hypothetical protein